MKKLDILPPTPETDKVEAACRESWSRSSGREEMAAHARKMERKCIELEDEIVFWRNQHAKEAAERDASNAHLRNAWESMVDYLNRNRQ